MQWRREGLRGIRLLLPIPAIFNEILTAILWAINVSTLRWKYRDKEVGKKMKAELVSNLEEVKERLGPLKPRGELGELMDFCITTSLFNELLIKLRTSGTGDNIIRFSSIALLTGILLGMRYAYDYGVPDFVLEQFEELPMFKEREDSG